jgi:hypothetical protein
MRQLFYKWTIKDKCLYTISLIPFVLMVISTLYVLHPFSVYISLVWILLFFIINLFQAGCCIGCPYRGKYCPAFCGVYLGNILSSIIYKNRKFEVNFFKSNAKAGETTLILFILFPMYWIILVNWYYVIIYIGLIVTHVLLFMPSQCSKCDYSTICPGGKAYQGYCKLINKITLKDEDE